MRPTAARAPNGRYPTREHIAFPHHVRRGAPRIFGAGSTAGDALVASKVACAGDTETYDRDALAPELRTAPCTPALAARVASGDRDIEWEIHDGVARLRGETAGAEQDPDRTP